MCISPVPECSKFDIFQSKLFQGVDGVLTIEEPLTVKTENTKQNKLLEDENIFIFGAFYDKR